MIYCISDIHGNYKGYKKLLEKVNFNDKDTLYVLGDVIDRGRQSIKILQDMMLHPNIIPIIGNHEYMGIHCLKFLMQEIMEESISSLSEDIIRGLLEWQNVGGQVTMDEFHKLSKEEKQDIINYLEEFSHLHLKIIQIVMVLAIAHLLIHNSDLKISLFYDFYFKRFIQLLFVAL